MRCAHKYDPVRRRLDRPVFFQCALPRRVRVDESLARSAANATGGSETNTFNNNATKAVCHKDDRPLRCLPMLEPSSTSAHALSHICKPSFKAQIRHQLPCVVVEVLAADTVAMRVRIISPAEDARVQDIGREEIAEPVHAVRRRPSLVTVSVQAMDGYNAGEC